MTITVSIGRSHESAKVTRVKLPNMAALAERLKRQPSTADGGAHITAPMRDGKRNGENADPTRIIGIDFDHLTPSQANALLGVARQYSCIVYQTRSSTKAKPRLRFLIQTARDVSHDEYPAAHDEAVAALCEAAGVEVKADQACAKSEQPLFTPVEGRAVEVHKGRKFRPSGASEPNQPDLLNPGRRNVDLTSLAGTLRNRGLNREQLEASLLALNRTALKPLPDREVKGIARSIAKKPTGNADFDDGRLIVQPLAKIKAEKVVPLWPQRFFRGKIAVVAGLMGLGKSTLLCDIAARVTTGAAWPDGTGNAPLGDVIILSTEDGAADTIRPRLEAMGADISRVHIIQGVDVTNRETGKTARRTFSLAHHMDLLDKALAELGGRVVLVIVDPITGVFHGADSHKTAEVRDVLAALTPVCERHQACFIGISHPNKSQGQSAAYRITGSLAFTAGPRSVYIVGRDPNLEERLILAELKNNLAPKQPSLAFHVIGRPHPVAGSVATIDWLGVATEGPDDILDPASGRARGVEQRTAEASAWLSRVLSSGPVLADEIRSLSLQAGISRRQVERAEIELRVIKRPRGLRGPWEWLLPGDES